MDTSAATGQVGIRTHILTTPELESNALDCSARLTDWVLYESSTTYSREHYAPSVWHCAWPCSCYQNSCMQSLESLVWGVRMNTKNLNLFSCSFKLVTLCPAALWPLPFDPWVYWWMLICLRLATQWWQLSGCVRRAAGQVSEVVTFLDELQ